MKREALPRDETLWLASHRDSRIKISRLAVFVNDRSDSMNPNNDAYQASMDNHSNQMNPNNDAY